MNDGILARVGGRKREDSSAILFELFVIYMYLV